MGQMKNAYMRDNCKDEFIVKGYEYECNECGNRFNNESWLIKCDKCKSIDIKKIRR